MNHCHLGIGPLRDSVDEFHHGSYRRSHDQLTEGSLTAPRVWTSPLQRGCERHGTSRLTLARLCLALQHWPSERQAELM